MGKKVRALLLLLTLASLSLAVAPLPQKDLSLQRLNVDLTLLADGTLLVTEEESVRFVGTFSSRFRELSLDRVTRIDEIRIWEGQRELSVHTSPVQDQRLRIDWDFPPTKGEEIRTFTLKYRVTGALRVYEEGDHLWWKAVYAQRSALVKASRVAIHLPKPLSAEQMKIASYGVPAEYQVLDSQTIAFTATQSIPPGIELEVRLEWPHGLIPLQVQSWQKAEDEAHADYLWEKVEADIEIQSDGTLEVTEEQKIRVLEGHLYHASRKFPKQTFDDIIDIQLWEGTHPFEESPQRGEYLYSVSQPSGQFEIVWYFPRLSPGEVQTFTLKYKVHGSIRIVERGGRALRWQAIALNRQKLIQTAQVRVTLPPEMDPAQVQAGSQGVTAKMERKGRQITLTAQNIPPSASLFANLDFTPGQLSSAKPLWQAEREAEAGREGEKLEEERLTKRQAQPHNARIQLGFLSSGIAIATFGLLGIFLWWYMQGRDHPQPITTGYLTEPPSDLPPGIVAYLVDEKVTTKGIVASLLHMASRGLAMALVRDGELNLIRIRGRVARKGQRIRLPDGERIQLKDYERSLFYAVLGRLKRGEAISLPRLGERFAQDLPEIYAQIAEESTAHFVELPARIRRRYLWAGQWLIILAIATASVALAYVRRYGASVFAPSLGLSLVGLGLMLLNLVMPRHRLTSLQEAARWRAFGRYMANIERYGDLASAQALLDKYFSYAVALGVAEVTLRQCANMEARLPLWSLPPSLSSYLRGTPSTGSLQGEVAISDPQEPPLPISSSLGKPILLKEPLSGPGDDLQEIGDLFARSLQGAEATLTELLNAPLGDFHEADQQARTPLRLVLEGGGTTLVLASRATMSTLDILEEILFTSSGDGGWAVGGGEWSGGR